MNEVNQRILDVSPFVEACYRAQVKAFSGVEYGFLNDLILKNNIRRVLDVGTGEGSFVAGLASQNCSVSFLGTDIDGTLIAKARSRPAPANLTYENLLFDSAFRGGPFDLITARFAAEHMKDVPGFMKDAFNRIPPGGLLLITEYFIDTLHTCNKEWKFFRDKELELYAKFGSHPRISLELPGYMREAGFVGIESNFRHIAPSTVGAEDFYALIISYANLYSSIEPELWTAEVKNRVINYCTLARNKKTISEDILLITHTLGRRP